MPQQMRIKPRTIGSPGLNQKRFQAAIMPSARSGAPGAKPAGCCAYVLMAARPLRSPGFVLGRLVAGVDLDVVDEHLLPDAVAARQGLVGERGHRVLMGVLGRVAQADPLEGQAPV